VIEDNAFDELSYFKKFRPPHRFKCKRGGLGWSRLLSLTLLNLAIYNSSVPKLEVVVASALGFSIELIFFPLEGFFRRSTRICILVYRVAPMAFGFSVGDFFTVGQLACLYTKHVSASKSFAYQTAGNEN
jgi:hypothetical protein